MQIDAEEDQPDHRYYDQEKQMAKKFDAAVDQIRKQYRIETIPWLEVTKTVVWIFLILTMI